MARKLDLTWRKDRKCWKKIYRGQVLYFSYGEAKSDKVGYERAWQAFLAKKAEIDAADNERNNEKPHAASYRLAFANHARLLGYLQSNVGQPDDQLALGWQPRGFKLPAERWVAEYGELLDYYTGQLERLQAQFQTSNPPELQTQDCWPTYDWDESGHVVWEARLKEADRQKAKAVAQPLESLQGNVDRYLGTLHARQKLGEISHGYVQRVQNDLNTHLVAFVGPTAKVSEKINAATVSAFKADILEKFVAETLMSSTAKTTCSSARAFITWLWQEEIIDNLPRNLASLSMEEQVGKIEFFEPEEIASMLAAASDRTKLYILLMLNCAMYPSDISDLRSGEVNWKTGTITRRRTKTKKMKSPPTVSYKLWAETWRLLQQEGHQGAADDPVLTNENGGALRVVDYKNGKPRKISNVASAVNRLHVKLQKRGLVIDKELKCLRKTGACKLEEHKDYSRFSNYFLAKSPKTDAEKRYAIPSQAIFDEALVWLGKQLLGAKPDKRALIVLKGGRPKKTAT